MISNNKIMLMCSIPENWTFPFQWISTFVWILIKNHENFCGWKCFSWKLNIKALCKSCINNVNGRISGYYYILFIYVHNYVYIYIFCECDGKHISIYIKKLL